MAVDKSSSFSLNIQPGPKLVFNSLPSQIPILAGLDSKSNMTLLAFVAMDRRLVLTHETVTQLVDLYAMFNPALPTPKSSTCASYTLRKARALHLPSSELTADCPEG